MVYKADIIRTMNEIIFISHILFVIIATLGALRKGKDALISLIALQAVMANLFVVKQMTLFGLNVTCSDVYSVGGILGLNLLNEYHGKEAAKNTVWVSFAAMLFFGIMSQMHLAYMPSLNDSSQIHFLKLLSSAPRILIASFIAYFISSRFDVWYYSMLKNSFVSNIAIRSGMSLMMSQMLDTALFSFLGLYGIVGSIMDIMILSYIIKLVVIGITTPFSALSKKILPTQLYDKI